MCQEKKGDGSFSCQVLKFSLVSRVFFISVLRDFCIEYRRKVKIEKKFLFSYEIWRSERGEIGKKILLNLWICNMWSDWSDKK